MPYGPAKKRPAKNVKKTYIFFWLLLQWQMEKRRRDKRHRGKQEQTSRIQFVEKSGIRSLLAICRISATGSLAKKQLR